MLEKMRCLFCKQDSTNARSIEHIVPESLGNKTLVLPKGYICDKCNNYFAIKVEKPFMELKEIKQLRFQEMIPNKKNKLPQIEALYNGKSLVKFRWNLKDKDYLGVDTTDDVISDILNEGKGFFVFPAFTNKTVIDNSSIISRFLAKMALETLAYNLKALASSLEELVDFKELDLIRNHARRGTTLEWPCSIRRIYNINATHKCGDNESGQKIYESDILAIDKGGKGEIKYVVLYYIFVLFGMEFAINMVEPEINEYNDWLNDHDGVSPLYIDKKD